MSDSVYFYIHTICTFGIKIIHVKFFLSNTINLGHRSIWYTKRSHCTTIPLVAVELDLADYGPLFSPLCTNFTDLANLIVKIAPAYQSEPNNNKPINIKLSGYRHNCLSISIRSIE